MNTDLPPFASTLTPTFAPFTRQTPALQPHVIEPPEPPHFFDKGGDGDGNDDDDDDHDRDRPNIKHFLLKPAEMTMAEYREEWQKGGMQLPKRLVKRVNQAMIRIEKATGLVGDYYDLDDSPFLVSEWERDAEGKGEIVEKRIPTVQEAFRVKVALCDDRLSNVEFDARTGNPYDQFSAALRRMAALILAKADLVDSTRR